MAPLSFQKLQTTTNKSSSPSRARDTFAVNAVNRCNTLIYRYLHVYSRYTLLTGTAKNQFLHPFLFTAVYSM